MFNTFSRLRIYFRFLLFFYFVCLTRSGICPGDACSCESKVCRSGAAPEYVGLFNGSGLEYFNECTNLGGNDEYPFLNCGYTHYSSFATHCTGECCLALKLASTPPFVHWYLGMQEDDADVDANCGASRKFCCNLYTQVGQVYVMSTKYNFCGTLDPTDCDTHSHTLWTRITSLENEVPFRALDYCTANGLYDSSTCDKGCPTANECQFRNLMGLKHLVTIDNSLTISSVDTFSEASIPSLEYIGQSLTLFNLPALTSVSFQSLSMIGSNFAVSNCANDAPTELDSLLSLDLNDTLEIVGEFQINDVPLIGFCDSCIHETDYYFYTLSGITISQRTDYNTLVFSNLTQVLGSGINIMDTYKSEEPTCVHSNCNKGLVSLSFPVLSHIYSSGSLKIENNADLVSISFPSLIDVSGDLIIRNNSKLTQIEFPNLITVSGSAIFSFSTSLSVTLDIGSLTTVGSSLEFSDSSWTSLPSTSLSNVGNLHIHNHPNLEDVDGLHLTYYFYIFTSDTPSLKWLFGLCSDASPACNEHLCAEGIGDMPLASAEGVYFLYRSGPGQQLTKTFYPPVDGEEPYDLIFDTSWLFDYCQICAFSPQCSTGTGYFCDNRIDQLFRSCSPCPIGKYCDVPQLRAPKDCPVGNYSVSEGSTSCDGPCEMGFECPNGIKSPCAGGTYQDLTGQTSCKSCSPGFYCPTQSIAELSCTPGTYSTGNAEICSPCELGKYQPASEQSSCIPCSIGYQCSDPTQEIACVLGTYQQFPSKTSCNTAPVGYFSNDTTTSKIACPLGTYSNVAGSSVCTICEPGYNCYCPDVGSGGCPAHYECVIGTEAPNNGSYYDGEPCAAGFTKCTGCYPCATGFYADTPATIECHECPPGFYCYFAYDSPLPCPEGRWSDGGNHLCDTCHVGHYCNSTHMMECDPGTYADDFDWTHCLNCTSGSYALGFANYKCENCTVGYECPFTTSGPIACTEGFYSHINGSSTCFECPLGYMCPHLDEDKIPCLPGTFANNTQMTFCYNCTIGLFSGEAASNCTACPIGFFCPNVTSDPIPCPSGTHSADGGAMECDPCPAGNRCPNADEYPDPCPLGTYQSNTSSTFCAFCEQGQYASSLGSEECLDCQPGSSCEFTTTDPYECPNGTYANTTRMTTCLSCIPGYQCLYPSEDPIICIPGFFSEGSAQYCSECDLGLYSDLFGQSACTPCDVGTYAITTGLSACSICIDGYYAPFQSSSSCDPCPIGRFCNSTNDLGPCQAGTYSEGAQSSCLTCESGTYQTLPEQNYCDDCPVAKYCADPSIIPQPCDTGSYNPYGKQSRCTLCMAGDYVAYSQQTTCLHCNEDLAMYGTVRYSGSLIGATSYSQCNSQFFISPDTPTTLALGNQENVFPEDQVFGHILSPCNGNYGAGYSFLQYSITVPLELQATDVRIKVTLLEFAIEYFPNCDSTYLYFISMSPPLKICGGLYGLVYSSDNKNISDVTQLDLYTTSTTFDIQFYAQSFYIPDCNLFKGFRARWDWEYPSPLFDPSQMITTKQIGVYENLTEINNVQISIPNSAFYNPSWAISLLNTPLNFTVIDENIAFEPRICPSGVCYLEPPNSEHLTSYLVVANATFSHISASYVLKIIVTNNYGLSVEVAYTLKISKVDLPSTSSTWNCTNSVPSLLTELTCIGISSDTWNFIGLSWPYNWTSGVEVKCNTSALDSIGDHIVTYSTNFPLYIENTFAELSGRIPFAQLVENREDFSESFNWIFQFGRIGGIFSLGNGLNSIYYTVALAIEPDTTSEITCGEDASIPVVSPNSEVNCTITTKNNYQKVFTCWGFTINGNSSWSSPPFAGKIPTSSSLSFIRPAISESGTSFHVVAIMGSVSGIYEIQIAESTSLLSKVSASVIVVENPDTTSTFSCPYPSISQGRSIVCTLHPLLASSSIWARKEHFTFNFSDDSSFSPISFTQSASDEFDFTLETTTSALIGQKTVTLFVDDVPAASIIVEIFAAPAPNSFMKSNPNNLRYFSVNDLIAIDIYVMNSTDQPMESLSHAFTPIVVGGGSIYTQPESGMQVLAPYNDTYWLGDPTKMSQSFRFYVEAPTTSTIIEISDGVSTNSLVLWITDLPDNTSYVGCDSTWSYSMRVVQCTFYPRKQFSSIYTLYDENQYLFFADPTELAIASTDSLYPQDVPSNNFTFDVQTRQTLTYGIISVGGRYDSIDFIDFDIIIVSSTVTSSFLTCNGYTNSVVTAYIPFSCKISNFGNGVSSGIYLPAEKLSLKIFLEGDECDSSICSITSLVPDAGNLFTFTITIKQSFVSAVVSDSFSNATIATFPPSRVESFLIDAGTSTSTDTLSHSIVTSSDTPASMEDSSGNQLKEKLVSISCAQQYCIAATQTGKLLSWGEEAGELLGRSSGGTHVTQITKGEDGVDLTQFKFIQVSALKHCTADLNPMTLDFSVKNIALTSEGYIFAWGNGTDSTIAPSRLNVQNQNFVDEIFDRIDEQGYFFLASTPSGDIYTWGRKDEVGCLGERSGYAEEPSIITFSDILTPISLLISGPTYGIVVEKQWTPNSGVLRYSPKFWVWETGAILVNGQSFLQFAKFISTQKQTQPVSVLGSGIDIFNEKYLGEVLTKNIRALGGNQHGLYFLTRNIELFALSPSSTFDELSYIPFTQCDSPPCFQKIILKTDSNVTALSVGGQFALAADGFGKIYKFTSPTDTEMIRSTHLEPGETTTSVAGTVSLLNSHFVQIAVIDPPLVSINPEELTSCSLTQEASFCQNTLENGISQYHMLGTQYILTSVIHSIHNLDMIASDLQIGCENSATPCILDCGGLQCFTASTSGTGWFVRDITIVNGINPSGNGGVVSLLDGMTFSIQNTTISNCSAVEGGAIASIGGSITLKNVQITYNHASSRGGAIFMSTSSQSIIRTLRMFDSLIEKNSAANGAGLHLTNIRFIFKYSIIENNTASTNGGGLNGEKLTVISSDSSLLSNKAFRGAGLFVRDATLNLNRINITSNIGTLFAGGIYVEFSTLSLIDSYISYNSVEKGTGGGIYAQGNRTLLIQSSFFAYNSAPKGDGGAALFLYCSPQYKSTTFYKNSAVRGGAIALRSESAVHLTNCTFDFNRAYEGGGAISMLKATTKEIIELKNISFSYNYACPDELFPLICPTFDSNSTSSFLPGSNNSYPTAYLESETLFKKYVLTRGGALEIYGNPSVSYENVFADGNYAAAGGFWYWDPTINSSFSLNYTELPNLATIGTMTPNWALQGMDYASPAYLLEWNETITESASGIGFDQPISVHLIDIFGQKVSVDWITTVSVETGDSTSSCLNESLCVATVILGTGRVHKLEIGQWRFAPRSENAATGYIGIQKAPNSNATLLVTAFIESSKVVRRSRILETSTLNIHMRECQPGEYDDISKCVDCQPGEYSNTTSAGYCQSCPEGTFMNHTLATECELCPPGTSIPSGLVNVQCFKCDCCFSYSHEYGQAQCDQCIANSKSFRDEQTGVEDLTQCLCIPDFYRVPLDPQNDPKDAQTLAENIAKYGSIDLIPFMDNFKCIGCPEGANCSSPGTTIENVLPQLGWYAELGGSNTKFYKCLVELACLNQDAAHPCYPGYTGHLCQQCEPGLGRESGNKCSPCPSLNYFFLIGAFLLVGLFILWTIYINITSATTQKQYSILIKVLISSAQFNMLALGFSYQWPPVLESLLRFQQTSMDTESLYNLDCLVQGSGVPSFFFQGVIYTITLACIFILPLFIFFIWAQVRYYYLSNTQALNEHDSTSLRRYLYKPFTRYYTAVLIISCFTIHPTITAYTLRMFSCQELNHLTTDNYLQADLSVECWTDYHIRWLLGIASPFLVFIVGVPLSVGLFMWRSRDIIVTGQARRGREKSDWEEDMQLRVQVRDEYIRKKQEKQAQATSAAVSVEDVKTVYSSPEYLLSDEDKTTDAWRTDISKQELEEIDQARYSYSFLYKGYERRVYGWEMVVISRKIALSIITVFFAYEINFQVIWSLVLVMGCILIHAYEQPFVSKDIDRIELYSLCTSFVTFFFGQFLVPDRNYEIWWKELATYIIVLANFLFLAFIITAILKQYLRPTVDKGIMTALAIREDDLPVLIDLEQQFLSNLNHAIGLRPEDDRIQIIRTQFPQEGSRRLRIFHIKILPPADDMADQMTSFEAFEKLCYLFNARDSEHGQSLWMGLVTRHIDPDLVNPSLFYLKHPTETLWQAVNSRFWFFVEWVVYVFTCGWTREEIEAKRRIGDDEQIDIEMPALFFSLPRNYVELASALEPPTAETSKELNVDASQKPKLDLSVAEREKYESKLKAADDVAKFNDDLIDYWR